MLSFKLRQYQRKVLQEARAMFRERGIDRVFFPLATGLGKTVVMAALPTYIGGQHSGSGSAVTAASAPPFAKTLVLVHRDELVWQTVETFRRMYAALPTPLRIGVEKAHLTSDPVADDVVVASVQSIGRRDAEARLQILCAGEGVGERLVIVDEAHHVALDSSYARVLRAFGFRPSMRKRKQGPLSMSQRRKGNEERSGLFLAGFSATPFRSDGQSLMNFYTAAVPNHDLLWGIRNGYLCDVHVHTVRSAVDISGVGIRLGDFAPKALHDAVNVERRNSVIVKAIRDHAGPSTLAFCASVRHAHVLSALLQAHGISAAAIDGTTDPDVRADILDQFRNGCLRVLCNYAVLTEGFDAPNCSTIVMARPTRMTGLYMQMLGRGTRPAPGVVETASTVQERLQRIAASSKPFLNVIDIVDVSRKHDVISAGALLGLLPVFDFGDHSLQDIDSTLKRLRGLSMDDTDEDVAVGEDKEDPVPSREELDNLLRETTSLEDIRLRLRKHTSLSVQANRRLRRNTDILVSKLTLDQLREGDRFGYGYRDAASGRPQTSPMESFTRYPAMPVSVVRLTRRGEEERAERAQPADARDVGRVLDSERVWDSNAMIDDAFLDGDGGGAGEGGLGMTAEDRAQLKPVLYLVADNGLRFRWSAWQVKDSDGEVPAPGARYSMKAIVQEVASGATGTAEATGAAPIVSCARVTRVSLRRI